MSQTQNIIDTSGRAWAFTMPNQVTLGGSGALNGGTNPLVIDIHYNMDLLFGDAAGKITISARDPLGGTLGDLRGPIQIVFHNDLGVPIAGTNGSPTLVIFNRANSDVLDPTAFHSPYAHFHGLDQADFPNLIVNPFTRDTKVADPTTASNLPSNPGGTYNYLAVDGTIATGGDVTLGNPGGTPYITFHQPDRLGDDSITMTIELGPNAIDANSLAQLQAQWDAIHPPPPRVIGDNTQATEGSDLQFNVRLDRASTSPVTVHYEAVNGTATVGGDFLPTSGDLTFATNETQKTVVVKTQTDNLTEGSETLTLALSNSTGAQISQSGGGTIIDAPPPLTPQHPEPTDFDGDGKADVLLQGDDGSIAVWTLNNNAISTGNIIPNTGFWHPSKTADFTGDGKADIMLRGDDGSVSIYAMNGGQVTSQNLVNGNPGAYWTEKALADFDGDGKADILWRGQGGEVAIWKMDGGQIASSGLVNANPGGFWSIAGTGDFNGDGKSDILWKGQDGSVAIWNMDNTTLVSSSLLPNPGNYWHFVGTGYFNGDSTSDILWRGDGSETAIWNMADNHLQTGALVNTNPGTYWTLTAAHDYNGDGQTDLLWHGQGGEVAIWNMQNGQITTTTLVANPGNFWDIIA